MQTLIEWDKWLFRLINEQWSNGFMDWLAPYLRTQQLWNPLYLFLILFAVMNYKKNGWLWVLGMTITIITTNFVSSNLIKENISRLRPCNDPSMADWVNVLVGYRPKSSSFTSSHAANHFGIAMFLYYTFRNEFPKWITGLFFLWAASICYAQVYVGVHYPIDVACGAIIGLVIGYLYAKAFNRYIGLHNQP
ncbi:phosphatase PAP2 family protein [Ferruginibacter sp. SUN002]|uniref:phosphatase PAP2 family protein n=1 Tax=Ferruginibacter sp. SUN002 TaxID=2937789 RepID=UPI003D35EF19